MTERRLRIRLRLLEEVVDDRCWLMTERVLRDDLGPDRFLALLTERTPEKDKRDDISMEMTL